MKKLLIGFSLLQIVFALCANNLYASTQQNLIHQAEKINYNTDPVIKLRLPETANDFFLSESFLILCEEDDDEVSVRKNTENDHCFVACLYHTQIELYSSLFLREFKPVQGSATRLHPQDYHILFRAFRV